MFFSYTEGVSFLNGIDRKDEIESLIIFGRKNGVIAYSEIDKFFSNTVLSDEKLEKLGNYLETEMNVKVINDLVEENEGEYIEVYIKEMLEEEAEEDDDEEIVQGEGMKMYLKEIGKIKLLTKKDEKTLAKQIKNGDELAKKYFVHANLRLVVSIARRYANKGHGLEMQDLVNEGNMGLVKAVEKFDHTKNFKFSTYATWWIRQSITRAIADQGRTIRLPVHRVEKLNKIKRISKKLTQKLGREPSFEEIAEQMGENVDKIEDFMKMNQETVSMETNFGDDDGSTLKDFIADGEGLTPEQSTRQSILKEVFEELFDTLEDLEAEVLRLRFGLDGAKPKTLEEVGRMFGVTRERIRQIEANAIRKLCHPSRAAKLRDFLKH